MQSACPTGSKTFYTQFKKKIELIFFLNKVLKVLLPPWQASGKTFESLAATGARLFASRLVSEQFDLPLRVLLRRWRRLTNALKKRSTPLDEARLGIITLRARSILVVRPTPNHLLLFQIGAPIKSSRSVIVRGVSLVAIATGI